MFAIIVTYLRLIYIYIYIYDVLMSIVNTPLAIDQCAQLQGKHLIYMLFIEKRCLAYQTDEKKKYLGLTALSGYYL